MNDEEEFLVYLRSYSIRSWKELARALVLGHLWAISFECQQRLWRHHDVNYGVDDHQNKTDEFDPVPAPLAANVTPENPLEIDVFDSVRNPYSYLVINRLAYLQSNYNCMVTMRVIFPGAIRVPDVAGGAVDADGNPVPAPAGGLEENTHYKQGGRWYKWADCVWDCARVGQFHGIPFKWANPDPIDQNHYPFFGIDYGQVPAIERQTWISWMVRLANAAQLAGKSMEFLLFTGHSSGAARQISGRPISPRPGTSCKLS
jgi:hypothetical protein